MLKLVIIGGGIAACEAAAAARKADGTAKITMLSAESVPPYRRPALSAMFGELPPDRRFYIKMPEFYAENRIDLVLDAEAVEIDRKAGTVTVADNRKFDYDRLVIATGGRARLPQLPGVGDSRVMTLRSYRDLLEIRRRLDAGAKNVVVIGGGVLGLELADSLIARGCRVTVLEAAPMLMAGRLDSEAAGQLLAKLSAVPGLEISVASPAEAILPEGVSARGRIHPADLVLFSAGMIPNCEIAAAAGVACGRGITVDDTMRSSDPEIFAAGDAAELDGRIFGLFLPARSMGSVAGANAVGIDPPVHFDDGAAAAKKR